MDFRTPSVKRLERPSRLNEAQAPPFPHDWKAGFRGNNDYMIGGGGSEEPYLKNGQWVLYVYNKKTGKHELYNYSTDMFELDESVVTESAIPADTRARMLMAVTAYDRRREKKPGYNPYALPQYCGALQLVDRKVAAGDTLRVAITSSFSGSLQDAVLKGAGEPKGTSDEVRGWGPRSKLRESVETSTCHKCNKYLKDFGWTLPRNPEIIWCDNCMKQLRYEWPEQWTSMKKVPMPYHAFAGAFGESVESTCDYCDGRGWTKEKA